MARKSKKVSFALYVHFPFCRRRCAYCDFVTFAGKERSIPSYITWLLEEWRAVVDYFSLGDAEITSCYFGGGTPSILSEAQIEEVITGLFPQGVNPAMEFTIEANPESLTSSKLACFKALGVNRISLGVQSFSDKALRRLGRVHTSLQAATAVQKILDNQWENFSVDIMYGLPDQTLSELADDLSKALSLGVPHLSAYCLTIAPGTPFGKMFLEGNLRLPSEERLLAMMDLIEEMTAVAGIHQYEISNYAKQGYACRHNLAYWHLEPYIGLGLGAVSFFMRECGRWGAHWENPSTFEGYERAFHNKHWTFLDRKFLSKQEAFTETLLVGLRLKEGVNLLWLENRFGPEEVSSLIRRVTPFVEQGWFALEGDTLKATRRGIRVLDALLLEIAS